MKSRQEIKALAKDAMRAQRGTSILLDIVVALVAIVLLLPVILVLIFQGAGLLSWILYVVVICVLVVIAVNMLGEFIKIYNREEASVAAVFTELKVNFLRKLGGSWWVALWYLLWSMLFVIPGIIKFYSYFFTEYILADCPNVTARQAIKISMRITTGHKWEIFVFVLSFIGWHMLSAFTLGILGLVFVYPYQNISIAGLYVEMRDEALASGRITRADLGWDA